MPFTIDDLAETANLRLALIVSFMFEDQGLRLRNVSLLENFLTQTAKLEKAIAYNDDKKRKTKYENKLALLARFKEYLDRRGGEMHTLDSTIFALVVQNYFGLILDGMWGRSTEEQAHGLPLFKSKTGISYMVTALPMQFTRTHTARTLRKRNVKDIVGWILHTTGNGCWRGGRGYEEARNALLRYQTLSTSGAAHFTITPTGEVFLLAEPDEVAIHAGMGSTGKKIYRTKNWRRYVYPLSITHIKGCEVKEELANDGFKLVKDFPGYDDWVKRNGDSCDSPLDLPFKGDNNGLSMALDFMPNPKGGFTRKQEEIGANIMLHLHMEFGIPLDVWMHYDVHPMVRAGYWGSWDLSSKFNWDRFRTLLSQGESS